MSIDMNDKREKLAKTMIFDAIISLLKNRNPGEIGIKEICEKANINRSTFYNYYGSLENAISELSSSFIKELKSLPTGENILSDNNEFFDLLLNKVKSNSALFRYVISFGLKSQIVSEIVLFFADNVKQKIKKDRPDISDDLINKIFVFTINGSVALLMNWSEENFKEDVAMISKLIKDLNKATFEKYFNIDLS